jgi:hypothetical protein
LWQRLQDDDGSLDQKHQYEDEAAESSICDFIDDEEEPDESDADAQEMTRTTCNALRNRRNWKETEFQCPLCADLRVVLRHLLHRKWSIMTNDSDWNDDCQIPLHKRNQLVQLNFTSNHIAILRVDDIISFPPKAYAMWIRTATWRRQTGTGRRIIWYFRTFTCNREMGIVNYCVQPLENTTMFICRNSRSWDWTTNVQEMWGKRCSLVRSACAGKFRDKHLMLTIFKIEAAFSPPRTGGTMNCIHG